MKWKYYKDDWGNVWKVDENDRAFVYEDGSWDQDGYYHPKFAREITEEQAFLEIL